MELDLIYPVTKSVSVEIVVCFWKNDTLSSWVRRSRENIWIYWHASLTMKLLLSEKAVVGVTKKPVFSKSLNTL